MKTIVTGTVGLDKIPYLERVKAQAKAAGQSLEICHVGQRMYAEAPDVAPGRILDLPLSRLSSLRRSVFKDILALADRTENLIVNTHATFRWKHGLFPAFDFDQLGQLNADKYVCLLDNVDHVHARLVRDHQIDHSLKDLLVWREEETLATEMMMLGCGGGRRNNTADARGGGLGSPAAFYLLAVGRDHGTAEMLYRLMFKPDMPKAYLSFPMTHVNDEPAILDQIDNFRRTMMEHFIVFDPSDLEEHELYQQALQASQQAQKVMEVPVLGEVIRFDIAEIMQVAGDIHAQIYARDFQLIDQSDMIISYIPAMPDGKPAVSSGVERELQHAHEATREVFVIWRPKAAPSPFITETATRVFGDLDEAVQYFQGRRKK
jgi:adenylate kinase